MSSTAAIIIAIISGSVFIYSNILLFFQIQEQIQNEKDPDKIISTGHRKYAIRNKEGELVEIDFEASDVGEKAIRFFSAMEEKYPE